MFHKIILVGNLGRNPEMRYAQTGDPVTNFSMATSEKWKGPDGQRQERTVWWRVSCWGKTAENVNEYLKKGSKVLVEGKIVADPKSGNPRLWKSNDGETRASFEVKASQVVFLSSKSDDGHRSSRDDDDADEGEGENDPF